MKQIDDEKNCRAHGGWKSSRVKSGLKLLVISDDISGEQLDRTSRLKRIETDTEAGSLLSFCVGEEFASIADCLAVQKAKSTKA